MTLHDRLEHPRGLFEVLGSQLRVVCNAPHYPEIGQDILEVVVVDAEDDVAIHLNEAAVCVPGEMAVARPVAQCLNDFVVEPQVENRVHHPGHRELRTRSHR